MPDLVLAAVASVAFFALYRAATDLADLIALPASAWLTHRATVRAVARAMRRDPATRLAVLTAARLASLDESCPL